MSNEDTRRPKVSGEGSKGRECYSTMPALVERCALMDDQKVESPIALLEFSYTLSSRSRQSYDDVQYRSMIKYPVSRGDKF